MLRAAATARPALVAVALSVTSTPHISFPLKVLHFDDDDLHHLDRIALQAGPILQNKTDLTTLAYTYSLQLGHDGTFSWYR